jgi:hypothetical protein
MLASGCLQLGRLERQNSIPHPVVGNHCGPVFQMRSLKIRRSLVNCLRRRRFDVHKKTISFCVRTAAGEIVEEGSLPAARGAVRQWAAARPQPCRGALEATLFSGWIAQEQMFPGDTPELSEFVKDLCFHGHGCLWNFFGVFLEILNESLRTISSGAA